MASRAIELNFGIMCNCLAVLKPFVRLVFPMLVPSSYGENRYPSGRSGRSNPSRHRKQSGSHPLESFDNGDGGGRRNNQLGKSGGVHGITVTRSYRVHSPSGHAGQSDTESTENIVESRGTVRQYHRMV